MIASNDIKSFALTPNAIRWLASGERGISSNTMFTRLTGVNANDRGYTSHPLDPDDFRRCELLLRDVPELRENLNLMANVSPVWGKLCEHWNEIVKLFESEVPGVFNGSRGVAEKTYDLMQSLGC